MLLLLALTEASCTVVGGIIGVVSASGHNDSIHVPPPPPPDLVEAPACVKHRRELEEAAQHDADETRRAIALAALPDCRVPAPSSSPAAPESRSVASAVATGMFVGAVVDVLLILAVVVPLSSAGNGDGPPVR